MNRNKLVLLLSTFILVLAVAGDTMADISNAAVLYLRIAAGARAAGMGEAFVAIADDATATHWNPAGLGAYPLANSWIEAKVPVEMRPLKAATSFKKGGASDYRAFEIWALTARGVARYDNDEWYLGEIFPTKTDQRLDQLVENYFSLYDEEDIIRVADRVAIANNRREFSYLEALRDKIDIAVPESYSERESMTNMLDSLLTAYGQCRINWDQVEKIEENYQRGLKDSVLTELEADRISIAIEKARMRFIAEEIFVPYSVIFDDIPNCVASVNKAVLFGTNHGLVVYNGRTWQTLNVDGGLPSDTVTCIASVGEQAFAGTAAGLARFAGQRLAPVQNSDQLPEGPVFGIGGNGINNVWAVIDTDLYHYDGNSWSNSFDYTVRVGDTKESIAFDFSVFGSESEQEAFLDKFTRVNEDYEWEIVETVDTVTTEDTTASEELMPDDLLSSVVAGSDTVEVVLDSAVATLEVPEEVPEDTVTVAAPEPISLDYLQAGMTIRVPFLADLKGKVNEIYVGRDLNVWIGTDYGLMFFDGKTWQTPGYRRYRIKDGDTFEALVAAKQHVDETAAEHYSRQLEQVNYLNEEPLETGRVIKIYRNPAADPINAICRGGERLYFATDAGTIEFDGVYWARTAIRGLSHTSSIEAHSFGDELWLATPEKLTVKASARSQFTFMHAKWLPELTDDVYYEYISAVIGTENWGTFGGNLTFITYGSMQRTDQYGGDLGEFESFDIAATASYGAALTPKMKVGLSTKILYSKLSDIGAGYEKGKGTSTGFAVDFGMLYFMTPRLHWGMALTNLGPGMAYIDASQSDPLPANLAFGFSYKLLQADYYDLLVTAEANKIMVGLDDGLSEEFKQVIFNGGGEFTYAEIIALRLGYIFDQEGDVKTLTLGVGLSLLNYLQFDFAYIPSGSGDSAAALKNTLRSSLTLIL